MIASVSTIKDSVANIQRFVRCNLAGGIDHMFIFLDSADSNTESWLVDHENVTLVVADDNWWGVDRPTNLNDRQRINANVMRAILATTAGVDWLFHIDGDEIVQIDHAALGAVPERVNAARLLPLEAVCLPHWDSPPTWFKRLLNEEELHLLWVLGVISKPSNGVYFHGHVDGKVGIRPTLDAWMALHQIVDSAGKPIETFESHDLSMLHFESYSGEDFVRKWTRMLQSGQKVGLRPVRERTARAVHALLNSPITEELRAEYLMKIFSATTQDDFATLRDLDLLVQANPEEGTHRPSQLPSAERTRIETMLMDMANQPKNALQRAGVTANIGPILSAGNPKGPVKSGWMRRRVSRS